MKEIEEIYKEEIIKEIFDSFDDEYRCNEYILITHKSVMEVMIKINLERTKNLLKKLNNTYIPSITVMDKQETKESMHNKIFIQMQNLYNNDMICGFYNTSTREFETDQEKINILQMMTQASLEIDEADYRDKFDSIMYRNYNSIAMV